MKVGEVAERAGVNVETLRYYERRGLLPIPDRTPSGHRRYDEETVRFLGAIKEAQAAGLTLTEIAECLGAARSSTAASPELRIRLAAKIDQIDRRIASLQRMREELARVVDGEPPSRPAVLHVTNGESAAATLRQTGLEGAVLPWQDVLHEGPVPELPREQLLRVRARFLADCGWGSAQALRASLERRDRLLLDALRDGRAVVLWFEHDLYDQLQLVDALALAFTERVSPELIVVGSFSGRPSFSGLGELTARELESLWPARQRAVPATLRTAARVWAAVQEPEPTAVARWSTRGTAQLPFLAPALGRLLEELPSVENGLSGTERRALEAVQRGARTPEQAFAASQRLEGAPFLGDTWFYRALSALGRGRARLLETEDGAPLPLPPPLGDSRQFTRLELRLTANGERTLRGEADRVELLDIDRWVGGTHVTPERPWRWDATRRRPTRR